jgi:hypothetical protein
MSGAIPLLPPLCLDGMCRKNSFITFYRKRVLRSIFVRRREKISGEWIICVGTS